MSDKNRWYDKYKELGEYLDFLKSIDKERRNRIIKDIMVLIKENNPGLFDDFVMEFPLEIQLRRWYDKDPYLWLIFNGLKYADEKLLNKVTFYLADKLNI